LTFDRDTETLIPRLPDILHAPRATFWRTLATFTITRVFIAVVLLMYLLFNAKKTFGDADHLIYWEACITYLAVAVFFVMMAVRFQTRFLVQLGAQVAADIIVISILYVTAGGGKSGLAILYLFPLAGGAILAPLVLSFFFVAAVTLTLLVESGYALLDSPADASTFQAGLYGAAFFVSVYAINRLAARLIKQEQLAAERGSELKLQEAINRLVIADMGDGILVIGRDGTVTTANPAAEKMLGMHFPYATPYLKLSDCPAYVPISHAFTNWLSASNVATKNAGLYPGTVIDAGDVFLKADHHTAEVVNSSTFVTIKPPQGLSLPGSVMRPGRRELTVHLKLRFARIETDRLVEDRSVIFLQDVSEIDNQAQQLKLASMGRLTASIAHEVRNPLSAISYSASLLMEDAADAAQTRLLKIVADNVTRLNRMIEDILRLSRKTNRPEEPLLLTPVITAIVNEFVETHSIAPALITVFVADLHRVWFDEMHLHEVLLNLLSNALRYASGKPGSIGITVVRASATRLELHVEDDGASITPEVRAHLFEPFYTTSSKGTGLGLYLARELCLNNGAVLDYEYRIDTKNVVASDAATMLSSGRFVITFATDMA
jgi:two-component system sensor histidine kinase PilS (NtrC family)